MSDFPDKRNMPRGETRQGWIPDQTPRFGHLLAEAWREHTEAEWDKPTRLGTKLRLSMVGQCARSTGYFVERVPRSDPMTTAGAWRAGLGTLVHEMLQPVVIKAFPGASFEFIVDARERQDLGIDVDLSGSGDILIIATQPERKTVIEVKTANGVGFKSMIGVGAFGKGGTAEGPKDNHLLQGSIEAWLEGADELVLLYLSLECIGPGIAKKWELSETDKFVAEWTIAKEQFEPLAKAELHRQGLVLERLAEARAKGDERPLPRQIPSLDPRARIVDPLATEDKGRWSIVLPDESVFDTGLTWHCAYCDWRNKCNEDGPS